jgi:putative aldouronate transport system permease protein
MERPSPPAQVIKAIFLISIAVAMLFPIVYVVAVSFSSAKDVIAGGLILWPKNPSLEAYQSIARGGIVAHALGVSVGLVVIGTSVKMIATVALAYGLSKRGVPGSKFVLVLVLATLLFRPGLIPSYLLVKNLGLIDTYQSLILPGLIGAFYLVILRNFFMNIPHELIEAARWLQHSRSIPTSRHHRRRRFRWRSWSSRPCRSWWSIRSCSGTSPGAY